MRIVLLVTFTVASFAFASAQKYVNAGLGYFGQNLTSPGLVAELEWQNEQSYTFSLPARLDLGYGLNPDYHSVFVDFNKGFRLLTRSRFFVEQSLGMGLISNFYTVDGIFYEDEFGHTIGFNDGANFSLMPSVTIGAGYSFKGSDNHSDMIWVRPKVFWNFSIRGLEQPFWALQVGYSRTIKKKSDEK